MPTADDELFKPPWIFPFLPISIEYILKADNEALPLNGTKVAGDSLSGPLWPLWASLGTALYIVGAVFFLVWIFTRDYGGRGPPWVPSFFRTEACCVIFEPIVHIWPALLWPLFLLLLLGYFIFDKTMHATTCCGREMTRSKRRNRWEMNARRLSFLDNIELAPTTAGTLTPASVRMLSVATESLRSPPPMYLSRVPSASNLLPPAKGSPSRVNSDPLPRTTQGSPSSSRSNSITDYLPTARGCPRKPSRLSVSERAESPLSMSGCAWDSEGQWQTRCGTCSKCRPI